MAISVNAVRAYLLSDAQGNALDSPQQINLAAAEIPYGARVRFEADIAADEAIYSPWLVGATAESGGRLPMFKVSGNTYRAEARLPWGFLYWPGHEDGVEAPLRFPLAGWPPFGGGEYLLRIAPEPISGAEGPVFETNFVVSAPPAAGGSAPRITQLTGPAGPLLIGQPWLMTAQVEDRDNDIAVVAFSTYRGGVARWWFLFDDGSRGDVTPQDGIYSFLRVGGDWWDREETGTAEDALVDCSVQAGDLRGNWSEPVTFQYQLRYSQEPLWASEPSPEGPNILETEIRRDKGLKGSPLASGRCDSTEAWVCGRIACSPSIVLALHNGGLRPGAVAGDDWYSLLTDFPEGRFWEMVFYAMPKDSSLCIGRKMAAVLPPA